MALVNPVQPEKGETSPELAAAVRLLRMRRGWLWTLVGSAVAWVVGLMVLGWDGNATGAATAAVAGVFVLSLSAVS